MVPVQLRLVNFLSYGTSAPVLDFEQFHVACLSGRNGQGKSALLDAITWALWGEARKSSGSRKPDEELIRIGSLRMQVEFVFDVEGERYRVVRSYMRSPSGKTTRPELELGIYESQKDSYRPLTGTNVRETQEHLNNVLGIDYETFINSAFLLQGRSDEFTKKGPSERKEILFRILNLDRFDHLAQMARERERAAEDRLSLALREIERLTLAVESEPEWRNARESALLEAEQAQNDIIQIRNEEALLNRQIAVLDSKEHEASRLRLRIAGIESQIAQNEADIQNLNTQRLEAEALIAQKDQIERDYDRYQVLQKERDELDTRRDLFRGIEKQIDLRQNELKDRKNELEKRIHALQVDVKTNKASLAECDVQIADEPSIRRMLEKVNVAKRRLEELNIVLDQHNQIQEQLTSIERDLHGMKEAMAGEIRSIQEQIRRMEAKLHSIHELTRRKDELEKEREVLRKLNERLDVTLRKGQQLGEILKERSGQLSIYEQELNDQGAELVRFRSAVGGTCPTCGTALTPAHRKEVEEQFQVRIRGLKKKISEGREWVQAREKERNELRTEYRELSEGVESRRNISEALATVEEQIRLYNETHQLIEKQREQALELKKRVDGELYGADLRNHLTNLKKELEENPFDRVEYDRVRNEAAQLERYKEQLQTIEQVYGRRQQLLKLIEIGERDIVALSRQLDSADGFGEIQSQIRKLKEQLVAIGFDPARFDVVRKELRDLSSAGPRMKDLMHAQQSHIDLRKQLDRLEQRARELKEDHQLTCGALAHIEQDLKQKVAILESLQVKSEQRLRIEKKLHEIQIQLGELSARIEQAERDRIQIDAQKDVSAEAKHEKTIFKQLRIAFGKHGIPSLIIEETLPEVEERANSLLERLTDGKMHVRLETLKDKKSGGTMETLEIRITDELGVARTYETFSGGEAFRVNFALRIALAQLLAERSGVRIRTLVIDEGFGTQDIQGLQSLVEAIQTIQEDFDKILVITHMDQLKEAFPVRIEVEKDPAEGSRFEVLGV